MVVLSAAIFTKGGKALLSRQFVEISRVRLEGLLAAFPKLIGSGKQHTFIETESVRYVYQPLESLYMLLLTNKSSNILEDLETLHLLAKIVSEQCRSLEEDEVLAKAFDLVFAFDEVVAVGYREKVTLQQIKTFMEMDSYEEKVHEMQEKNKEREAKIEADKKRAQIEKMRQKSSYPSISPASSSSSTPTSWGHEREPIQEPMVQSKERKPHASASSGASGMRLQKKEATSKFMREMEKEEGISVSKEPSASAVPLGPQDSVNVEIVENVRVILDNEGGVNAFEVKGDLNLIINDSECARIMITLNDAENKGFAFKTHPNINKGRFLKEKVIALNPNKLFPTGNALNVLKWRWQTNDEAFVPITVNCWPTPSGDGTITVNMEYELRNEALTLGDVHIAIPIASSAPTVGDVSVGTCDFDTRKRVLTWKIDLIDDSNQTGAFEFTVASGDKASFLPIGVSFVSRSTFCDVQVEQVVEQDEGTPVTFSQSKLLTPEEYSIV